MKERLSIICIVVAFVCMFLLAGEALSLLVIKRQIQVYYGTSFLTTLFLFSVIIYNLIKIKSKIYIFLISLNIPIALCYLGFVIEIFKTGIGPAMLFGIFNEEVSGILFNYSTGLCFLSIIGLVYRLYALGEFTK